MISPVTGGVYKARKKVSIEYSMKTKRSMLDALNQTTVVVPEEEEDYNDPFKRLQEDIIISHILNRIPDVKSLSRVSMVSRYFANLVPETTQYVSVKVPGNFGCFEQMNSIKGQLRSSPIPLLREYIPIMAPLNLKRVYNWLTSIRERFSSSSADSVIRFLGKFKCLRSIYWEYDSPERFAFEPVFKWKLLMTPSKSVCIMLLTAWGLDYDVAAVNGDGGRDFDHVSMDFDPRPDRIARFISELYSLLENMLESPQKHFLVIDSKEQGKVDIKRDDLVELRTQGIRDSWRRLRFWHSKVLKLPLSGCAMKRATLHLVQTSKTQNDDDAFCIAKQAFDGEDEEVFAEAAFTMLKTKAILDCGYSKQLAH